MRSILFAGLILVVAGLVASCEQQSCGCGGVTDTYVPDQNNEDMATDVAPDDTLVVDFSPQETEVGPEPVACITVEPSQVIFAKGPAGESRTYPVTVGPCPTSTIPLQIQSIELEGDEALLAAFALDLRGLGSQQLPLVIPLGETVTFGVVFTPLDDVLFPETGLGSVQVVIASNSSEPLTTVDVQWVTAEPGCPKPVIQCTEGADVVPQTVLHLVGSQSLAYGAAINKWEWTVVQPAMSSSVFIPSSNFPDPSFEVNAAGIYEFQLDVWDSVGNRSCMPAVYEVMVTPDEGIRVELFWQTPGDADETDTGPLAGADVDLHFAHPWANKPDLDGDGVPDPWFDETYDCYQANPDPAWGSDEPGVQDNPMMKISDDDGQGPEAVSLVMPENINVYRVGVHYKNANGFGVSVARIRVFIYGILVFEIKDVELTQGDLWDVCTVEWPSGKVTQVAGKGGPYKITAAYGQ